MKRVSHIVVVHASCYTKHKGLCVAVDDIFYTSGSTGETVSLNSDGLFFGTALGMRGYSFNQTVSLYGITDVQFNAVQASVDVEVYDRLEWDILRRLAVRDTFNNVQGTFTVLDKLGNKWVRKGNFTADSLKDLPSEVLKTDMSIVLYGMWWKESALTFTPNTQTQLGDMLDYPYDYPIDYGAADTDKTITVGGSTPANMILRIYGHCTNPRIKIGNNAYSVATTVGAGERLDIDTYAKTITRTAVTDTAVTTVNEYANRLQGAENSGTYVFQRIPLGDNTVSWNGSFGFEILLREMEAETPWML